MNPKRKINWDRPPSIGDTLVEKLAARLSEGLARDIECMAVDLAARGVTDHSIAYEVTYNNGMISYRVFPLRDIVKTENDQERG